MVKCYYCGGSGCSQCKKMTTSSYGEIEQAQAKAQNNQPTPSPNGGKVVSKTVGKSVDQIVKEAIERAKARPKKRMFGWVSNEHDRAGFRKVVYRHVHGHEIKVSWIQENCHTNETGWKDGKCIGEVTEYLRQG